MLDKRDVAAAIESRREELGKTQTRAAKDGGVSLSAWNQWENAKRFPTAKLESCLRGLELGYEELMNLVVKKRQERLAKEAGEIVEPTATYFVGSANQLLDELRPNISALVEQLIELLERVQTRLRSTTS